LSDKFVHLSPYNYASNNPVTNIDLWGLQGVNSNFITEFSLFLSKFSQGSQKTGSSLTRLLTEQKVSSQMPQEVRSEMGQMSINRINKKGTLTDINNAAAGVSEMGAATLDLAEAGAKDAFSKGQVLGDAVQVGGILTANPLAVGAGEAISDISTAGLMLIDVANGESRTKDILFEGGKSVAFGSWQGYLDKAEKLGDLAKPANDIYRGINYTFKKITESVKSIIENKNHEDQEDKDKR
jgi:hypothetical protein